MACRSDCAREGALAPARCRGIRRRLSGDGAIGDWEGSAGERVGEGPRRLLRPARPLSPPRTEKEVRLVFADTLYWGAALHPHDQYRAQVVRVREALGEIGLVTTDEVLTELLDGLAQRGTHLRQAAVRAVRRILDDRRVTVHPQSRESFLTGLHLYEQRYDKGYSLVDCISMTTMRRQGISEVLTNDRHFTQEGFTVVLR